MKAITMCFTNNIMEHRSLNHFCSIAVWMQINRKIKSLSLQGKIMETVIIFPYACRMAVSLTRSRWGSISSLQSRTACVPLRRWSELCCALWSSPPLDSHEPACRDPHRCPPSHLQHKVTTAEAVRAERESISGSNWSGMRVCVRVFPDEFI